MAALVLAVLGGRPGGVGLPGASDGGPRGQSAGTPIAGTPIAGNEAVAAYRGGPTRTGQQPSPGPADGLALRWSVSLGESAYGDAYGDEGRLADAEDRRTPVVAGGLVYVAAPGGSLRALDAASGQERWRATGPGDMGLATAPVVAGDTVYVGFSGDEATVEGLLVALDAATGVQRWRTRVDPAADAPRQLSAPIVADGRVYVVSGPSGSAVTPITVADGRV